MKKQYRYLLILLAAVVVLFAVALSLNKFSTCKVKIDKYVVVERPPKIYPDYTNVTLPTNIAPLNFMIKEKGQRYFAKIYSDNGQVIEVCSSFGKIIIPVKSWHKLLDANKGGDLYFDIFVEDEKANWLLYSTVTNKIALETIDNFLVYRKIHPVYSVTKGTQTRQRDLRNYNDTPILDSKRTASKDASGFCFNCHAFVSNKPDKMFLGMRTGSYGNSTLLVQDGKIINIDTKFGYTTWHPSGKLAVYSINGVRQFIHSARKNSIDVIDVDSTLAYYVVDEKKVKTSDVITSKDRQETFPCFSADGKYLYFASAPILWTDLTKIPPDRYKELKYDIVRASYDVDTDTWGRPETIIAAKDTELSATQPRISPDNRWLVFCMHEYSCWAGYQSTSDLYIVDLDEAEKTGEYKYQILDGANSDESESWHSWSSNSRWLAVASKKGSGLFTRIYLAYIDTDGKAGKAFIVPQKDPAFYDFCIDTIGMPELVIEPVKVKGENLAQVVRSGKKVPIDMPATMASPKIPQGDNALQH